MVFHFREKCRENRIKSIVRMTSNGIWNARAKKIVEECIKSVYKELHADHETGAADNK